MEVTGAARMVAARTIDSKAFMSSSCCCFRAGATLSGAGQPVLILIKQRPPRARAGKRRVDRQTVLDGDDAIDIQRSLPGAEALRFGPNDTIESCNATGYGHADAMACFANR